MFQSLSNLQIYISHPFALSQYTLIVSVNRSKFTCAQSSHHLVGALLVRFGPTRVIQGSQLSVHSLHNRTKLDAKGTALRLQHPQ